MTGEELRERRMALHLSQATLADKLGVTKNTVARWERGELRMANPQMVEMSLKQLEEEMTNEGKKLNQQLVQEDALLKMYPNAYMARSASTDTAIRDLLGAAQGVLDYDLDQPQMMRVSLQTALNLAREQHESGKINDASFAAIVNKIDQIKDNAKAKGMKITLDGNLQ